jgi:TIR domain-containing protein
MASPVEIFCCYARKDQQLLNELKAHLMPLQRQGLITLWADTDINAGMEWEKEIEKHLDSAQIILFLVSPDFMASEYCYSKEMKRAMERYESRNAYVIPIIFRPVYWEGAPFGKLQALPTGAKPVIDPSWQSLDAALVDVAEGIRKVVELYLAKIKDPYYAYIQATSGKPVLTDPLSCQSVSDWVVGDWDDSSFFFSEGAFRLTVKKHPIYAPMASRWSR